MTDADRIATAPPRSALIDALRGAALAGVLLVNLGGFSLYYFLDDAQRAAMPTARVDAWLHMAIQLLAQDKAITLFSLLFGVGTALQAGRATTQGPGDGALPRRLLVLLAIGLLHAHLLWWGDILAYYAIAGLLLLALRRLPDRWLLAGGFGLALFWPLLTPVANRLLPVGLPDDAVAHARALAAFSSSDVATALRGNVAYAHWNWMAFWGVFPFVLARLMIGDWIGRRGILQQPDAHRALLRRTCWIGLTLGLGTGIALEVMEARGMTTALLEGGRLGEFALRTLRRVSPLAQGLGYGAGFALLFLQPAWARRLVWLAPMGRMALTLYLMQSLIGVALFYGTGADLGPQGGLPLRFAVWIALFGAQALFSRWWLARFRLGPVEWLWRSLAARHRLPLRRATTPDAAGIG
ncbi:MAG: DUF418 domain-containing protein [Lysobacteraceae bacterium]